MQSMPITTKVVTSNVTHGEVYSIHHYVIKLVSDLQQVGLFSPDTPTKSTNKTEILLKEALYTITHLYKLVISVL
jgi:hypothetical protein